MRRTPHFVPHSAHRRLSPRKGVRTQTLRRTLLPPLLHLDVRERFRFSAELVPVIVAVLVMPQPSRYAHMTRLERLIPGASVRVIVPMTVRAATVLRKISPTLV
jgi:hypothetical protein